MLNGENTLFFIETNEFFLRCMCAPNMRWYVLFKHSSAAKLTRSHFARSRYPLATRRRHANTLHRRGRRRLVKRMTTLVLMTPYVITHEKTSSMIVIERRRGDRR